MFEGTDRWVSSGQNNMKDAIAWADALAKDLSIVPPEAHTKLRNFAKDFF